MTAESMLTRRSVVLHEDDVAMTHGANSAFAELFACGSCSAGSVMVPCPWFPEAADLAVTNRELDVGVHLTLTSENAPIVGDHSQPHPVRRGSRTSSAISGLM
jgi:predicted glycoside hydrolase/deacetylase ChbG (UPF0249 family)